MIAVITIPMSPDNIIYAINKIAVARQHHPLRGECSLWRRFHEIEKCQRRAWGERQMHFAGMRAALTGGRKEALRRIDMMCHDTRCQWRMPSVVLSAAPSRITAGLDTSRAGMTRGAAGHARYAMNRRLPRAADAGTSPSCLILVLPSRMVLIIDNAQAISILLPKRHAPITHSDDGACRAGQARRRLLAVRNRISSPRRRVSCLC